MSGGLHPKATPGDRDAVRTEQSQGPSKCLLSLGSVSNRLFSIRPYYRIPRTKLYFSAICSKNSVFRPEMKSECRQLSPAASSIRKNNLVRRCSSRPAFSAPGSKTDASVHCRSMRVQSTIFATAATNCRRRCRIASDGSARPTIRIHSRMVTDEAGLGLHFSAILTVTEEYATPRLGVINLSKGLVRQVILTCVQNWVGAGAAKSRNNQVRWH